VTAVDDLLLINRNGDEETLLASFNVKLEDARITWCCFIINLLPDLMTTI
jgi:hypothetical protein